MKNILYLIGFMGVGKSTVGKHLSRVTGWQEIDLDTYIEIQKNRTIQDIFDAQGEDEFRKVESAALRKVVHTIKVRGKEKAIISCGGGIVLKDDNIRFMKKSGIVVYLHAETDTLEKRLADSTSRPLLKKCHWEDLGEEESRENASRNSIIKNLLEQRLPLYEKAADYIIITDKKTPEELCTEILKIENI